MMPPGLGHCSVVTEQGPPFGRPLKPALSGVIYSGACAVLAGCKRVCSNPSVCLGGGGRGTHGHHHTLTHAPPGPRGPARSSQDKRLSWEDEGRGHGIGGRANHRFASAHIIHPVHPSTRMEFWEEKLQSRRQETR
ncbi:hypothetical protein AAFF_G00105090 [Aldrovandia affinis]|uniref:Uncharacterized protein n=1 Tax=Aldrovandia affinis TaxID=143900 RepID=A0AAD7T359_9TELE|nr:hypothetical protein AAFF_G00105090 [Aldrovandia affinis]